jgi:hypothetical protein
VAVAQRFVSISKSEFNPSWLAESVHKINLPEKEEGYFPIVELGSLFGREASKIFVVDLLQREDIAWRQFESPNRLIFWWSETGGQGTFTEYHMHPVSSFFSWCLTTIFKHEMKFWHQLMGASPRSLFNGEIGPQLSPSVAHHNYDGNDKGDGLNRSGTSNQISGDFRSTISSRLVLSMSFGLGGFLLSVWAGAILTMTSDCSVPRWSLAACVGCSEALG